MLVYVKMELIMYDFAYVHHTAEHIEIVNTTKNPLDPDVYTYLEVRRDESPNVRIYCKKEFVDQVLEFYTK